MYQKVIVCYVDYSGAADFFLQMSKIDQENKYIFITTLASVKLRTLSIKNAKTILLSRLSRTEITTDDQFEACKERYLDISSVNDCRRLFSNAKFVTEQIMNDFIGREIVLLTWNGNSVFGNVMRHIKSYNNNLKVAFLEISNLPGLLFVDHEGVNSSSAIYRVDDPAVFFREFEKNGVDYNFWSKSFVKNKLMHNSPPPQSSLIRQIKSTFFVDFIFSMSFGFRFFRFSSVKSRLPKCFSSNKLQRFDSKRYIEIDHFSGDFNFFPMQVSTDSQLKLNSDFDNFQALQFFLSMSQLPIIVKIHPADLDTFDFEMLDSLDPSGEKVYLTNDNTYDVVNMASEVFIINSTLGLESMIFSKPVTIIGKSFYSRFNELELSLYVSRYLICADFFKPKKLTKSECDNILARAR